ncbi:MAG: cupin domain-containing protein [bacterium]|nr:cupin domain-containing protein [bacterium]
MPAQPTRRVVTGNDANGRSVFVHDGPTPGQLDLGLAIDDEIWIDDPANPDPQARIDPAQAQKFRLEPPSGGSVVRVFTFLPAGHEPTDRDEFAELVARAAARFDTGGVMEEDSPGMHTTKTIDYGIVLSGEVFLELDEGEAHLRAGDVVVQRGTRHAWHNRGTEPCRIAFILIGSSNYR